MVAKNNKANRDTWDKLTGRTSSNDKNSDPNTDQNSGIFIDKFIDKTPDEDQTLAEDLKGELWQTAEGGWLGTAFKNAWTAFTDLFGGNPFDKYQFGGAPQNRLGFATGGVVTSPTNALIGEAGRSEAVIPLDNSPQMQDLIEKIADRVEQKNDSGAPIEVRVFIGGTEWDAFTYKSAQRGKNLVGPQPITVT